MKNAPSFLTSAPDINTFSAEMTGALQKKQEIQAPYKKTLLENTGRMKKIEEGIASSPLPAEPKLADLPKPPDQVMKDPVQGLSSMGAIIGIFGSLLTRAPLTSALNAGASAMQAYHKGDMENLALERTKFNENLKVAMAQNDKEIQQYKLTMEHYGGNIQKAQFALHAIEAENKNPLALSLLETGNIDDYMKLKGALFSAGSKAAQAGAMLSLKAQGLLETHAFHAATQAYHVEKLHQEAEKVKAGMPDQPTRDRMAVQSLVLGPRALASLGQGSTPARIAVAEDATRIGHGMGLTDAEMAIMPLSIHAQAKALDEQVSWTASLKKYEIAANSNAQVMLDYANKIGATDIKSINKAILAGKREFGNPDANAYVLAFEGWRRDYSRVMSGPKSNAQLHTAALKKVDNVLSEFSSIPSLEEDFVAMKKDMNNQSGASNRLIEMLNSNMLSFGKNQTLGEPPSGTNHPPGTNQSIESLLNKYP